jgi:predicted nucleotidyltransferase
MDQNLEIAIKNAAAVLKAAGAKEVFIFGSAARGTMRDGSDVDFAISGLPPEAFYRAMSDATRALGRVLDLVDLDEVTPFTRYLKEADELRRVA